MSQEVSSNPRPRSVQGDRPPIKPWSAESDADKLMDELFSDIDRILDGGSKLPTEPVKPEYISLQPIVIPPITTPPSVESPQEPAEEEVIPEPTPTLAQESVEPIQTSIVHKPSPPLPKRSGWSFEKFLVAVGLASVIATIVLLLANQKKITWPWTPQNAPSSSPKMGQLSGSDAEFVNYMRRSLDVLDNKSKAKQNTKMASASGTTNPPSPPSGPVSGNRPQVTNQPQSVPGGGVNFPGGPVFFPVYPPQGASASSGLPQALRPPMPAFPQTVPAPAPALPQAAKPTASAPAQSIQIKPQVPALPQSSKPSASAPAQPIQIKPQVPALPQSAKPSASTAAQPAKPSAPPIPQTVAAAPSAPSETSQSPQSSAPAVQHTLMGVMELGDRSAALFEVNGVTKRFNVGESIGASGWTLVSVTNSEAMVRRNGEVRSIYPGQKF